MMKNCVFDANGKLINIGDWDYQYQQVETGTDAQGNPIYENVPMNPLPTGATIVQKDVSQDADGGWSETGSSKTPNAEDRIKALEDTIMSLMGL